MPKPNKISYEANILQFYMFGTDALRRIIHGDCH